jgi:periplasmic protein TonB
MLIAIVVSVGIHLAAALLLVVMPRVLPKEAPQQEQGTVELLMVEKNGALPGRAGQPNTAAPAPAPPEKAEAPKTPDRKVEAQKAAPVPPSPKPAPAALTSEHGNEPLAPPAEPTQPKAAEADTQPARKTDARPAQQARTQPAEQTTEAQPAPPRKQEAPVFDLAGTDSDSNAIAMGNRIIPAMQDDRFRNRPPIYPTEAAIRGQHGTVMVVIHVSASGLATGVDVIESSGFGVLDQAAVTAVRKWRFRPAIKEGRPVPFNMPFRFVFEAS